MKKLLFVLIFGLLTRHAAYSQGEAGAIFLLIPPSATLNGMGEIGVCLPSSDPVASFFNPANGLMNYDGTGLQFQYSNTPWLPALADDMSYSYQFLGMSLPRILFLDKIAFSYGKTFLDLGLQRRTDANGNDQGSFRSYMKSDMLTLSAEKRHIFNTPLTLDAGLAAKKAKQFLSPSRIVDDIVRSGISADNMVDLGLMLRYDQSLTLGNTFALDIQPAFGVSILNVGDSISFGFPGGADPAPRTLRTGLSLRLNLKTRSGLSLLSWQAGHSASDLLINATHESWAYQGGFGDINFVNHVLRSEADNGPVQVERGDEITFLDFLSFRSGRRIDNYGGIDLRESGIGVKSSGLLQSLYAITGYPALARINRHILVEYNLSDWNNGILQGTHYSAFTVTFNNLFTWFSDYPEPTVSRPNFPSVLSGLRYSLGMSKNWGIIRKKTSDDGLSYTPDQGFDLSLENEIKNTIIGISLARYQSALNYSNTWEFWGIGLQYSLKITLYDYFTSLYVLRSHNLGSRARALYGLNFTHNIYESAKFGSEDIDYSRESTYNTELIAGFDTRLYKELRVRLNYFLRLFPEKDMVSEGDKIHIHGLRLSFGI